MRYTVKSVADVAGVSVRTLHHYDRIGLLKPASVTASGYRQYTDADLEALQQVLYFRELGFSLDEIKAIIHRPGFDRKQALSTHKKLLLEKQVRLQRLIESVDQTIDALERGVPMSANQMFEGFGDSRDLGAQYRDEASQKYGKDVVDASYRRVASYSKQEWAAVQAKLSRIQTDIADRMDRGPADAEVQELVAQWRQGITDTYYDCTLEIFRGLGDLYVNDERFMATYENIRPGLAKFMQQAIHLYCDRMEAAKS